MSRKKLNKNNNDKKKTSSSPILPEKTTTIKTIKPVNIIIKPTRKQLLPLALHRQLMKKENQRQRRQDAKSQIIKIRASKFVKLRFYDVQIDKEQQQGKFRREWWDNSVGKYVEAKFIPILWSSQAICKLEFTELSPFNSCFTFA